MKSIVVELLKQKININHCPMCGRKLQYILSVDIAKPDSKDQSVMMHFRVVDGKYIYEGCEKI